MGTLILLKVLESTRILALLPPLKFIINDCVKILPTTVMLVALPETSIPFMVKFWNLRWLDDPTLGEIIAPFPDVDITVTSLVLLIPESETLP